VASKVAELLLKIKSEGEEQLSNIGDMLTDLGKIGAAAFAAISAVAIKSLDDYSEQEQAINSLTRAMVNNGTYSKELRDSYVAQADALSKITLFGDEQIVAAQSLFTQQTNGLALTEKSTKAILDFAQSQNMDLNSAFDLVSKTVNTQKNVLAQYKIEVDSSASASEKMAQIVGGLNKRFGGQAEAATEGLGSLKLLSKAIGELSEGLGEKLAPSITLVSKELLGMVNNSPIIMNLLDSIGGAFKFLVKEFLSVSYSVIDFGRIIGGTFGTLAGALSQIAQGEFTQATTTIKDGFKSIKDESYKLDSERAAMRAKFEQSSLTSQQQQAQKEIDLLNEANENKKKLQQEQARKQQEILNQENENKKIVQQQNNIQQLENQQFHQDALAQLALKKKESDIAMLTASEDEKKVIDSQLKEAELQAQIDLNQKQYDQALTHSEKIAALKTQGRLKEQLEQQKADTAQLKFEEAKEKLRQQNLASSLSTIASLSQSGNKTLAAIGKAAALTQIAIDTPAAISKALASAPPPFNFALAAGVGVAMAQQAAQVSGVQLAEGGIVRARPGGIQATIGEGGQDEAVIPLDRAGDFGFGGGGGNNISINVYGGLMGSETEAHEFAKAIDRELLKLRQNNESVSFDSRVI
jgi:hypothetical protein